MNIKLSYIVSFLVGAGILGIIFWITGEGKNESSSPTSLHQTIFKEQEKLKEQIRNRVNDKTGIEDYRVKIESAISTLKGISLQGLKLERESDTARLSAIIYPVYLGIEQARNKIYRNTYSGQPQDDNFLKKELDNSFLNIDNQYFKSFRVIYDYHAVNTPTENPRAIAFGEIVRIVKDSSELRNRLSSVISVMDYESKRLASLTTVIDGSIKEVDALLASQDNSLKDLNKSSKDRLLMVVVLPIFALIIILLFVIPYLYKDNDNIIGKLFEEKVILQVFTVFILVITILLLGIGDKINGETLGTLLGGISVYVLQNALGGNGNGGKPGQKPAGDRG